MVGIRKVAHTWHLTYMYTFNYERYALGIKPFKIIIKISMCGISTNSKDIHHHSTHRKFTLTFLGWINIFKRSLVEASNLAIESIQALSALKITIDSKVVGVLENVLVERRYVYPKATRCIAIIHLGASIVS